MRLSSLIPLVSLLSTVTAAALAKRRDGVHIVECQFPTPAPPDVAIVFCPDDGNCNSTPSSSNICWVGSDNEISGSCPFSSGVTFTWSLESNAASAPLYSVVGSGSNGFQEFTARRDDGHIMFQEPSSIGPANCRSEYYFL